MTDSSIPVVNHHADHPGFGGVAGAAIGFFMLFMGRGNARLTVDLASVSEGDRVVDIGCGPGTAARAAARRGASVVGIDPATVMLRLAGIAARRDASINWARGTAEALPLTDEWASVVWSLKTVHHWQDVTAGLTEVRRVLAPTGRFLVIERRVKPGATGLASHGWTEQQAERFAAQCRATGFEGVRVAEHRHGRNAAWTVQAVQPGQATLS
ncbi:MAG TPA: class I SAM-dependent methyltransferase [Mycobacterium sp.]|nr:class I SAM-dependent methyltransferase [Mycobacterium sp.]